MNNESAFFGINKISAIRTKHYDDQGEPYYILECRLHSDESINDNDYDHKIRIYSSTKVDINISE